MNNMKLQLIDLSLFFMYLYNERKKNNDIFFSILNATNANGNGYANCLI